MAIAEGRAALMAMRDNLIEIRSPIRSSNTKFLPIKRTKPARARDAGVLNDATLNMPDFIETVVFHPGAGFLTTNTAGVAIASLSFYLHVPQHFNRFWQLFTKRIRRDFGAFSKMVNFILIVVAYQ